MSCSSVVTIVGSWASACRRARRTWRPWLRAIMLLLMSSRLRRSQVATRTLGAFLAIAIGGAAIAARRSDGVAPLKAGLVAALLVAATTVQQFTIEKACWDIYGGG